MPGRQLRQNPAVRHFPYLGPQRDAEVFAVVPAAFDAASPRALLGEALGAALYTPATQGGLARRLARLVVEEGLAASILCLEDSIHDDDVARAEANVIGALRTAYAEELAVPLLFVRLRSPDQMSRVMEAAGRAGSLVTGFVLPKFSASSGRVYLDTLRDAAPLAYAMPIVETPEIAHRETRADELTRLRTLLDVHRDRVLCVRLGGVDLCGLYGLRRPPECTIWDVGVVRDVIADVVNVFGRVDDGWPISGAVWEYYRGGEEGLVRELRLDGVNGLTGKSVIHPSQVRLVNAMHAVSWADHGDALAILADENGGAAASATGDRMNEPRPHRQWARKVLRRAGAFGVLARDRTYRDLLEG